MPGDYYKWYLMRILRKRLCFFNAVGSDADGNIAQLFESDQSFGGKLVEVLHDMIPGKGLANDDLPRVA